MNPVVLIIGGIAALYLLKGGSTAVSTLTPLQAAQLAAAQQSAALQKQQNNTIGQLLSGLLGGNKQQPTAAAAPKSSGGGGGGSSLNQAGGSGASKPAGSGLGCPLVSCPMTSSAPTGGGSTNIGAGVCEHPDGTVTVNGQLFCESTGQPISQGPCFPPSQPAIACCSCDVGQQNFNICGGLNTPAGGVSTFCTACSFSCFGFC